MYNDRLKPELKPFVNKEEALMSKLSPEELIVISEIKDILNTYKDKVMSVEKKDFFSANKTRDKIRALEDKMVKERKIIPKNYVLWHILVNILEDVVLPERNDLEFDTKEGNVQKYIENAFKTE